MFHNEDTLHINYQERHDELFHEHTVQRELKQLEKRPRLVRQLIHWVRQVWHNRKRDSNVYKPSIKID